MKDKELLKVKEFLLKNPVTDIFYLSNKTGVSYSKILKFINEGSVSIIEGTGIYEHNEKKIRGIANKNKRVYVFKDK